MLLVKELSKNVRPKYVYILDRTLLTYSALNIGVTLKCGLTAVQDH